MEENQNYIFNFLRNFNTKNISDFSLIVSRKTVSIADRCLNSRTIEIIFQNNSFMVSENSTIRNKEYSRSAVLDEKRLKNLISNLSLLSLPPVTKNILACDAGSLDLMVRLNDCSRSVSWTTAHTGEWGEFDNFVKSLFELIDEKAATGANTPSNSGNSGNTCEDLLKNLESHLSKTSQNPESPQIREVSEVSERSFEPLELDDLTEIYTGSVERLKEHFLLGDGRKWFDLYDIESPLAVALCQGAAMHYFDKKNGVKDIDVWFFYPFNKKHLPYRTYWNWDYINPKFGRHPDFDGYSGRKVDVLVRSIKSFTPNDPVKTIHDYLEYENTTSSKELAKKAVVLLSPESLRGKVVWYKQKAIAGE